MRRGPLPEGASADYATIINQDGASVDAPGGAAKFYGRSTAHRATLIAYGGNNGGFAGHVEFCDNAVAAEAAIKLPGGTLSISYYSGSRLTIGSLEMDDGTIET